ncbi:hypothetical protein S83_030508 [Arachis hypogaea]
MEPTHLKWTTKLLDLDFEIKYRLGMENKAADALSRQMMANAASVMHVSLWKNVDAEIQGDLELQKITMALQQESEDFSGYSLKKGRLFCFYQGRAILPANSAQIPSLLPEHHDSGLEDILDIFELTRDSLWLSIGKGCGNV